MSFRLKEAMFKVRCREPGCSFYSEFVVRENIMGATEADVDSEALKIARNLGYIKHDALYGRVPQLSNPDVVKVSAAYDHLGTGTDAPSSPESSYTPPWASAQATPQVTPPPPPAPSAAPVVRRDAGVSKPAAPKTVKKAAPAKKKAAPAKKKPAAAKKKAAPAKKKTVARKKPAPAKKKAAPAKKKPTPKKAKSAKKSVAKKKVAAKKKASVKKRAIAKKRPSAKKKSRR